MTDFARNLQMIYERSGVGTRSAFAYEVGIDRSVVSRLLNGNRTANGGHLLKIAQYCGVETDDLLLNHSDFKDLYTQKIVRSDVIIHSLRVTKQNLKRCEEVFPAYRGQYRIFTNTSEENMVNVSLLEIIRLAKEGIEFTLVNPYLGVDDAYSAFTYSGYMLPVDEFLYFFGEQDKGTYEILTMIFKSPGSPEADFLNGLWAGIGVKDGDKFVASVPALACRTRKPIEDWREHVGTDLGFVMADTLPEIVRRRLRSDVVKVLP